MNPVVHYTRCPVCNSTSIVDALVAKDFTVSGKAFAIWECSNCSLRFTQDAPGEMSIGAFYKSENYISHTNTSKGIINGLYQIIRKRTLKQKRNLISNKAGVDRGTLLDVGSGTGAFVREMIQHGWSTTGLEPDAGARNVARTSFDIELKNTDELFNLSPNSFDAITLWHVLEHVHDLQKYITQLKALLKSTGALLIAVPNYTSFDASVYREFWAAYDVPRHLYHFSPSAMLALIEENGMKIIDYKPMWFDSFYVSLLSSKYKTGKTRWMAAGWNALVSNLKAIVNRKKCSSIIYVIRK